jgi:hypothetical protein
MTIHPTPLSEFSYDFSEALDTSEFLPDGFYKVADAVIKEDNYFIRNPEVNPIAYVPTPECESSYKVYKEVIYVLSIDGKVAKIGGTKVGMKGRFSSYNCGTRKARAKGTCSVTNYNITESQFSALMNGSTVEWFAYDVPEVVAELDVFGESHKVKTSLFTKFEAVLLSHYKELTGTFPILSDNSGVD